MAMAAVMVALAATERAKSAEAEELGGELGILLASPAYICGFHASTRRASPCCCRRVDGRPLSCAAVEEALS